MPDHDYGKITKGNEDSEYFTIGNKRVNGMDIEVVYCKDCENEEGEDHVSYCRIPLVIELKDRVQVLENVLEDIATGFGDSLNDEERVIEMRHHAVEILEQRRR